MSDSGKSFFVSDFDVDGKQYFTSNCTIPGVIHPYQPWNVHGQAMVGDPSSAIIKEAVQWDIELIIVGTQGRSAIGRLILGSVSHEIAVAAPCSVRVARCPVERRDLPIRIMIGFDGSAGAQTVVKQVAHRTWPVGSEAFIVAVDEYLKPTKPETEMNLGNLIAIIGDLVIRSVRSSECVSIISSIPCRPFLNHH